MGIGPGHTSVSVTWAQEWQRLSRTAIDQAMRHYLRGCANVAMARTPWQALMALQETQISLLRYSVHVFDESTSLWRKQHRRARHAGQASARIGRQVASDQISFRANRR